MISMSMYIDKVVTEASLFDNDIESLFFEIAMEEEVAKDPSQPAKEEPGMIDKMVKTIQELFVRLNGMIQKSFLKFKNFLTQVMQQDNGFEANFRKAFKNNKPMEGVKLIAYDYKLDILDQELKNMTNVVTKLFAGMANKTSYIALSDVNTANDMDRTPDEIYNIIFKQLNCPSDVNNIDTYFVHMKNKFRSEKKEMLFVSSKTQEYYQITKSCTKLSKNVQNSQNIIANQVGVLKNNLNNTILNKMSRPEVKKRAMKQCKNLTHVLNLYIRFVDIYMQLNLERLYTYRTILKKLYQFQ